MINITTINAFTDNYIYILNDTGKYIVIDPGDTDAICDYLQQREMTIHYILVTHHHSDHIAAIGELFATHHCDIIAPEKEMARIPDVKHTVKDGDSIRLHQLTAQVIETPGHTKGHICYYFPEIKTLFSGDTLFAFGCGRLMEGTAAHLFHSLTKLRELPDDTMVYCGHEYTLKNIDFTRSFAKEIGFALPDLFEERAQAMHALLEGNPPEPTMPFRLGDEKLTNLFMMADNPELIEKLQAHGEIEAFSKIRQARNSF